MKTPIMLTAAILMTMSSTVKADDTGFASIHDWRNETGRVCMLDHFHDGAGKGLNRKAAEAGAISSWSSFTVFEYGSNWGSYAMAASKKMECTQNGAAQWSCDVAARPCKRQMMVSRPQGARGRVRTQ